MALAVEHRRLAITTFEEAGLLEQTLAALQSAGLTADQVCIVGQVAVLSDLVGRDALSWKANRFAMLFCGQSEWASARNSKQVAAAAAPLLEVLAQMPSTGPVTVMGSGGPERASPDADGQGHDGDVALVVRAKDPQQHVLVTRTLLANSQHKVTTYEYALHDTTGSRPRP